jgi:hypothetical protein
VSDTQKTTKGVKEAPVPSERILASLNGAEVCVIAQFIKENASILRYGLLISRGESGTLILQPVGAGSLLVKEIAKNA